MQAIVFDPGRTAYLYGSLAHVWPLHWHAPEVICQATGTLYSFITYNMLHIRRRECTGQ